MAVRVGQAALPQPSGYSGVKFVFNLQVVRERPNRLVSLQACPNLNTTGMELPLLLFEAGPCAGLDCRILPVHPRDGAGKREAHFSWHCSEKVVLTPLSLGNGRKKRSAL